MADPRLRWGAAVHLLETTRNGSIICLPMIHFYTGSVSKRQLLCITFIDCQPYFSAFDILPVWSATWYCCRSLVSIPSVWNSWSCLHECLTYFRSSQTPLNCCNIPAVRVPAIVQDTTQDCFRFFSRPYWVVRSRLWYDVLSVCRLSVCNVLYCLNGTS